ncbi:MAG: hypothetical protein IH840_08950, partial [Candidatus Heimdallarchaeota archaeon]|nr:hypothetical protein [Candidatus Heimdallarchaeota archaeon]
MQFKDPRVSKKQKGSDSNNTARLTSSQIVILEGGDGVGKTSVGKNMAETLKGTYISTPTRGFKKIRNYVESLGSFES